MIHALKNELKKYGYVWKAYSIYKYMSFGVQLFIEKWRDARFATSSAAIPLPPPKLRFRVHGALDRESFIAVGARVSDNLRELVRSAGRDIDSFNNILDFGCGSGRVLSNFLSLPSTCRLHGVDIDAEAIDWCQRAMSGASFKHIDSNPPTGFADNSFDFIFAISVFTHLDEAYQFAWLKELHRIAQPGAILVLSVHGEPIYERLPMAEKKIIRHEGFFYKRGETGRLKLDGLPDFYQNSYHSREYIRREWSKYFQVIDQKLRGIGDYQDAVVLRKD